ncbi:MULTISPECIES: MerR family transcriptional regulator [Pseudomonadota]|uniref:Repressor protein c n=5 Tax=root TaxID=1 RepID=REPC_BPMU|nr:MULTISPECIES: DNA-binding protein [Pseudomonadota]P06019.2 RecName: Full=Repressor protein c; Short=Repc; AltName: Full=CI; AltName: Full=Gene product 1; Short=gp1; AltName: Full=Mu repressor; Short=MuR [Escherichia phage Mu]KJX85307.1 Repressor protein CI [Agrobacterium tumefaciens]WOY87215.1 DNA-binding protein [Salmonella enterica]AAF01132.2 repressor protein c [Escherichia phage Mu]ACR65448.1 Repressor protein CI [Escherichia coli BW2952]AVR63930.1 Mu DNA-binding domain protein [Escher
MKSNFIEKNNTEKSIWCSPQEIMAADGMPGSVAGVHYRANVQGWTKQKKEGVKGGKAVEYDVMSMPTKEREQVIAHLGLSTPDTGAQANEKQDSSELINKLTTTLINMIEELEPDEARKALKLLSKGGLLALMPLVFNEQKLYSFIGFSQQSIQTLMMLDALPEEKRKEILSKYGIHEQESVVVPSQEPQEVKKAV